MRILNLEEMLAVSGGGGLDSPGKSDAGYGSSHGKGGGSKGSHGSSGNNGRPSNSGWGGTIGGTIGGAIGSYLGGSVAGVPGSMVGKTIGGIQGAVMGHLTEAKQALYLPATKLLIKLCMTQTMRQVGQQLQAHVGVPINRIAFSYDEKISSISI